MKELNAFNKAIAHVREVCARMKPMCEAIPEIMKANDPSDALIFGIKGAQTIIAERDEMLSQFERAACNFLGEGKRQGETFEDCFIRICMMSPDEILAAPERNGLQLRL
jgi:hypothetical protein